MHYAIRRILGIIPVLFFTWTIVFGVIQLIPGDPVNLMLAGVPASEEVRENERRAARTRSADPRALCDLSRKRCARRSRRILPLAPAGRQHDRGAGRLDAAARRRRPRRRARSSGFFSACWPDLSRTPGSIPLCMLMALAGRFAAEFLDRHDADLRFRHDRSPGCRSSAAASRR